MSSRGKSILRIILFIGIIHFSWAIDGEALFKTNCTACHKIESKLVGPALKGVHERWQNNVEEMIAFIRNSQAYIKSNRPMAEYARKVFEENNKLIMTPFENLSDEEIKAILDYIKTKSSEVASTIASSSPSTSTSQDASVSAPTETQLAYDSNKLYANLITSITILSGIVVLLIITLVILVAKIIKK